MTEQTNQEPSNTARSDVNLSPKDAQNEPQPGQKRRIGGQPGNMNAFKHGLGAVDKRRERGTLSRREKRIKAQVLDGLIDDKGGEVSTAQKILAELIADDAAWLVVFNRAIERVIRTNAKARENPRGLAQLDAYKRPVINSLTANLQKYGLEKIKEVRDIYDLLPDRGVAWLR